MLRLTRGFTKDYGTPNSSPLSSRTTEAPGPQARGCCATWVGVGVRDLVLVSEKLVETPAFMAGDYNPPP